MKTLTVRGEGEEAMGSMREGGGHMGALTEEQRAEVEEIVSEALRRHDEDALRSLTTEGVEKIRAALTSTRDLYEASDE